MNWFKPMTWARNLVFAVLLALDFKHTYEFVMAHLTGSQTHEPVLLFGPLFVHVGIPMTNGVFDALAYAFTITATIYFVSNTLAKRLAHNHPSLMYYVALGVGVLVSALTNAGTMFYGSTGTDILPAESVGWVLAGLGAVVTAGLLMFASMDAWDMKARVQKASATREQRKQARMEQARKEKYTPRKHRLEVVK